MARAEGEAAEDLAPISEQESNLDRSALIAEEHEKIAKSEMKQTQILESLTKKDRLPFSNDSLGKS